MMQQDPLRKSVKTLCTILQILEFKKNLTSVEDLYIALVSRDTMYHILIDFDSSVLKQRERGVK